MAGRGRPVGGGIRIDFRQCQMCHPLVVQGQRPSVGRLECLQSIPIAAEHILPYAQPDGRGRAAVAGRLEFLDSTAQRAVGGRIGAQHLDQSVDLSGAECAGAVDEIADIEFSRCNHGNLRKGIVEGAILPKQGGQPAVGIEPTTPALRMRCSAN